MAQWLGQAISVECNDNSIYQGIVDKVDSKVITLQHTFKNGKPCDPHTVSLLAQQIKELAFVAPIGNVFKSAVTESSDDEYVKNSVPASKRSESKKKPVHVVRAKTITQDDTKSVTLKERQRSNSFTAADSSKKGLGQCAAPSPKRYTKKLTKYDTECFGVTVESCMGDFDFEKNLALFDKQRVYSEIESGGKSNLTASKAPEKYKHDEMIIKQNKVVGQIKLMDDTQSTGFYVTDDGLVIPSITYEMRQQLFMKAASYGFTELRRIDTIGRNTCDMVFHLIGGSRRMNLQNTHQKPTVVVLCGPHTQGCYGVACAKNLANHNINTIVFTPAHEAQYPLLEQELSYYDMCGAKKISTPDQLPTTTVDLIITCLDSQEHQSLSSRPWYKYITNWCNTSRAHVLAIDPPDTENCIEIKWSIHIGLPQTLPASAGQTYLCDIGLPKDIFKHIGIKYRSPFGIKFCVPLYSG